MRTVEWDASAQISQPEQYTSQDHEQNGLSVMIMHQCFLSVKKTRDNVIEYLNLGYSIFIDDETKMCG